MTTLIGGIWIPISDSLYTTYNTAQNSNILHDDGLQQWLRLRVAPDGYQPLYEFLGTTGVLRGIASNIVFNPGRTVGFEITTLESREVIRHIMESLRNTVITVRDYVTVDAADTTAGYTARQVLVGQLQHTGSIGDGTNRYYPSGFVLNFEGY